MRIEVYLDIKLKEIAPIHGMSFGNLNDKNTWQIDFKDEATEAQKAMANNYLANFAWDTQTQADAARIEQIQVTKDNINQPMFKYAYQQYKVLNPLATKQDFINYLSGL